MELEASDVSWAAPWPAWAAVLVVGAAVAWTVLLYIKEQRFVSPRMRAVLAGLRLTALAIIATMLWQPTLERSRIARPRVVVALDRSASMETRDVQAAELGSSPGSGTKLSRINAWRRLAYGEDVSIVERLKQQYDVDVVEFARDVALKKGEAEVRSKEQVEVSSDADPSRQSTHLGDAIDFAVRRMAGPRPTAVVVMTDGINTAGLPLAEAATRARTLGVPVNAVAIGSDRPRPDVALTDVRVEAVAFPGDRLQVEAAVKAAGYAGRRSRVMLKDAVSDETLAEAEIKLPADGLTENVLLPLRPTQAGTMRLAVEAEVQAEENDPANNRREFAVEVRSQPIRTLLASATPSFEFRALKSLLERDPAIELKAWLQDADPGYVEVEPAAIEDFARTEAELWRYDVIVLGDVDPDVLPDDAWEHLRAFVVEHGGGLVLIAGPRFMPTAFNDNAAMRLLIPVEADRAAGYRNEAADSTKESWAIVPTPLGIQDATLQVGDSFEQSTNVWGQLPAVTWTFRQFTPKPGAQVLAIARPGPGALASADERPVILRHYVGAGETLMHLTDESWRWRWRSDDRYFARYWGQVVRRLARGRALRGSGSLAANQSEYRTGEPVRLYARLQAEWFDAASTTNVNIEMIADNAPTRTVNLPRSERQSHVFEAVLHNLPADHYVARLARENQPPLTTEFTVLAAPSELSQLAVNTAALAEVAATTGGKLYTVDTAAALPEELPAPKAQVVERLPAEPLWNSPWLLAGLAATLGAEWLLRRRAGML